MSAHGKLVAVRFLDGRLIKGWTINFRPNREFLHVRTDTDAEPVQVGLSGLKAIFFIKTPDGDPRRVDRKAFDDRPGIEKKVWIEFEDGECMPGWSSNPCTPQAGFYVFPTDPECNLERAYVLRAAIRSIEIDEAAERASDAFQEATRPPASSAAGEPLKPPRKPDAWSNVGRYSLVRRGNKLEPV